MGALRNDDFRTAIDRVSTAISRITGGDPAPYIDCWSRGDDVTLFGAWGPIEKGYRRLSETFEWVGRRFTGPGTKSEIVSSGASGNIGYTIGFERGLAAVDGASEQPMTIRVTHIYRREDGQWKLVHRHADFPPKDPRG